MLSRFQWRWQFFRWRCWQGCLLAFGWQLWSQVDSFGLWLTRRVRVKLMSSGLLLLAGHLLLIGFRSHSSLSSSTMRFQRSVVLINFLMSHICSGECYISRRIRSFPSLLCACACPVGRQTEDGRKMSKKENSRMWRDFWQALTSTAALSCLAVEYAAAAALVKAHNPRLLSSIYNWTDFTWICDIFRQNWSMILLHSYLSKESFYWCNAIWRQYIYYGDRYKVSYLHTADECFAHLGRNGVKRNFIDVSASNLSPQVNSFSSHEDLQNNGF